MQAKADQTIAEKLPARLRRLEELAYNFWWSWHRSARDLFKVLDRMLWIGTRHNPILILREIEPGRLAALAKDPAFLRQYDAVLLEMDRDLKTNGHWFSRTHPTKTPPSIAYFSAEFGVHISLPIYSGGLGVLSGDHLKEASDLGLPLVAVGFLYEQGYFRQQIDPNGWQQAIYPVLESAQAALRPVLQEGECCRTVPVEIGDRTVTLQIWKVEIGRVPLFLMDANHAGNAPWDRELTARLYGGDQEMRIQQEILLGVGGVRILRALGYRPRVWHINEGHSAFMLLERLREFVAAGEPLPKAVERVQAETVFTTHTPVAAGHDVFSYHLMEKYFQALWPRLGLSRDEFLALGGANDGHTGGFNMTALALRLSRRANAVSRLHGEVSRRMWRVLWPGRSEENIPIGHVTNGVHVSSWVGSTLHTLYRKHLAPDWVERHDQPTLWEKVRDIPDAELWIAHRALKRKMLSVIRERARVQRIERSATPDELLASGILLDPEALVVGFARRFATYKRATLVLRDAERLARLLHDRDQPVQIVFAGKAHPADDPAKRLLQEVFWTALNPQTGGRVAFVEDYDLQVARYLVQGVDVWLNTPLRPLEASGTSGMKAALNGVLNLSVLDGWWAEAYDGRNGWAIDSGAEPPEGTDRNAADADRLYALLAEEVAPLFYKRDLDGVPRGWVEMMKNSIRTAGESFSSRRMVQQYAREFYLPALADALALEPEAGTD
jgi:starch phosphorylase